MRLQLRSARCWTTRYLIRSVITRVPFLCTSLIVATAAVDQAGCPTFPLSEGI